MSSPSDSPRRFVVEQMDPIMVEAMRAMSPYDKLLMLDRFWLMARELTIAGVREQHPEFTEEQVLRETANRMSEGWTERVPRP